TSSTATATATASVATLRTRYEVGARNAAGYRPVVRTAGEPHLTRTELGVPAQPGRASSRQGLLAFVQLSDVHIVDAQSPLRVEWTDRFDDPGALPASGLFTSAYRAQEMLTAQVSDSMVRAINEVASGPVTGQPLALAIQTGDNSDNSQLNEVRWNIEILNGAWVHPDSGDRTRYEGVADGHRDSYDPAYWHPHGNPLGTPVDRPRQEFGFPVVPGLLDAARNPFKAKGLAMPWYSVFGNHDGLVQGNFPAATMQLDLLAQGGLKVISPPAGAHPNALLDELAEDPVGLLTRLLSSPLNPGVRLVTPDPDRTLLTRKQVVQQHFELGGAPTGHGFTQDNLDRGTAYYTFDRGEFRFVVMDTVNPNGYYDGSLDLTQFLWLSDLLARSADKVVLVFSHHPSASMENPFVGTGGDPEPRIYGPAVLHTLLAHPQVIAWVNGHTHANTITPRRRPDGGGLWEITTASHIDWPQQARVIEVADNTDGTLSIFATMVDHAAPASYNGNVSNPTQLASLARELSANDWHDHSKGAGTPADRNVELLVANPLA
ncbi:TIGR03767 family metallophosphoesterase, partial [Nocardioides sp.]